jgi:hypothetical protein
VLVAAAWQDRREWWAALAIAVTLIAISTCARRSAHALRAGGLALFFVQLAGVSVDGEAYVNGLLFSIVGVPAVVLPAWCGFLAGLPAKHAAPPPTALRTGAVLLGAYWVTVAVTMHAGVPAMAFGAVVPAAAAAWGVWLARRLVSSGTPASR